ncbi:MAG: efflux RND transporter periplasmic adaptor subunit [Pseudobdellovibrionaceae bacterium]|nr:efflux RND transporter periplasmic adaptor subunit [Pseudobdellovibrionaceae bacterium]
MSRSIRYILDLTVILLVAGVSATSAYAQDYKVTSEAVADQKAVFATVETVDQISARARISGTIISLNVKEGDRVEAGQEIALVGDDKLALQIQSMDAQMSATAATRTKTEADLKRVQSLIGSGSVSKAELDAAKAAYMNADNQLKALTSQRQVIEQQVTEGKILAPTKGRVLQVPMTLGAVIMPGETVATLGAQAYILRLQLPERHARSIKVGDTVHLDREGKDGTSYQDGQIILVYPEIENGRVSADAQINGLEDFFVGERVRVWVSTGERQAIFIPSSYITTRAGIDYVAIKETDGKKIEIPVQRGHVRKDDTTMTEILSGLHAGDTVTKTAGAQ